MFDLKGWRFFVGEWYKEQFVIICMSHFDNRNLFIANLANQGKFYLEKDIFGKLFLPSFPGFVDVGRIRERTVWVFERMVKGCRGEWSDSYDSLVDTTSADPAGLTENFPREKIIHAQYSEKRTEEIIPAER